MFNFTCFSSRFRSSSLLKFFSASIVFLRAYRTEILVDSPSFFSSFPMAASDSFVGLQSIFLDPVQVKWVWFEGMQLQVCFLQSWMINHNPIWMLMGKGAYRLLYLSYCQTMLLGCDCYYGQRILRQRYQKSRDWPGYRHKDLLIADGGIEAQRRLPNCLFHCLKRLQVKQDACRWFK